MKQDNKSHLFKHVHSIATGFDWYNYLFFKIIDKANSNCFCLFVCLFVCLFLFLFHLLFLLSLMLIIGIFYCLNFTLLLLHLITRHLVLHLSFSSVIFRIPALIIGIFYCLDCTSLLLHLCTTQVVTDFTITMLLTYILGNYYGLIEQHYFCANQ